MAWGVGIVASSTGLFVSVRCLRTAKRVFAIASTTNTNIANVAAARTKGDRHGADIAQLELPTAMPTRRGYSVSSDIQRPFEPSTSRLALTLPARSKVE